MAQRSCPTDSLKGTVCSETMTVHIFSSTCLAARNMVGDEGGVHRWVRHSPQSDTAKEEGLAWVGTNLQALHLSCSFLWASLAACRVWLRWNKKFLTPCLRLSNLGITDGESVCIGKSQKKTKLNTSDVIDSLWGQFSSFILTTGTGCIASLSERESGSKVPPSSSHGHFLMTC